MKRSLFAILVLVVALLAVAAPFGTPVVHADDLKQFVGLNSIQAP